MDAPALPVLSAWAPGPGGAPEAGGLARVPGLAASPAEARARAREAFPGRDVLVQRAGVALPGHALARLLAAWQAGDWDALSPLDGRWPLDAADPDAAAWTFGDHAAFAWDTVSGECALWRADAPEAPRAAGLLPCVHAGDAAADPGEPPLPVRALQARLAAGGAARLAPGKPVLLHVLHAWGGGAERFVRDLMAADNHHAHLVLVARGDDDRPPFGRRLCLHADLDAPPLRTWPLAAPVADCAPHSPEVAALLDALVREWGIGAVLVSSLVGHSLDVLRTGLPTTVCAHDAFPLWPLLHDARDPGHAPFDRDTLARALAEPPAGFVFAGRDADAWWSLREALLAEVAARGIAWVAPSASARERVLAIAPALRDAGWRVIPHGLAPLPAPPPAADAPPRAVLRVLVPGRLHGAKGNDLLEALVPRLPADIELVLLGAGPAGDRWHGQAGVHVLADYARDNLPRWIATLRPDLALLPSTVPETFGYALSEMHALGLPVLCAGIGAYAERLRAGGGWAVAPEADAFAAALAHLAGDRAAIEAERARIPSPTGLAAFASAWQAALADRPAPLRLPPASVEAVAALASKLALDEADARHDELTAALAGGTEELARRTDWALALDAELRRTRAERDQALAAGEAHEAELARRADALRAADEALRASEQARQAAEATRDQAQARLASLDNQLAEAHGYYQRDTADLARQRDVALAQRDEAREALARIRSSLVWRLTWLPRRLAASARSRAQSLAYHWHRGRLLASRGLASLRSRGLAGTWQRFREWRASRARPAASVAAPLPVAGDIALRLPQPAAPRASVIVPVYNQLALTLACLRALADCGDATPFEVIVVDDGSSDETPARLPSIPGLRFHRNPANLGFIGACNAGAALARGEFLVFLNNDTTVQPGWLDALLSTFRTHPDTGLAGSKLVYPDGRLQEAGGIVFADGSGWNYGRFDDPAHPRYNFVREVDYCSGAAIALPAALFGELGGFDPHYAPAYYEDTDLAMRVRARGLKVRYQPASVVVHHEGATSGTDTGSGIKAYQVANQKKFLARWREVLAKDHLPASAGAERASERGRRRQVLVLDACTPTPDRDSRARCACWR